VTDASRFSIASSIMCKIFSNSMNLWFSEGILKLKTTGSESGQASFSLSWARSAGDKEQSKFVLVGLDFLSTSGGAWS